MALMCQGEVTFSEVENKHDIRMREYFEPEFAALSKLAASGLVEIGEDRIDVTVAGWFLVRAIAMVFDRHLGQAKERHRFSRIV